MESYLVLQYNKSLKHYSRELRKNMTDAERLLWSRIRGTQVRGHQFYRQKIVGDYIVDFYCPRAKLIIELGGGQHYSIEGKANDVERGGYMARLGIRFSDREVIENIDGVLKMIWKASSLENLP